jgi:hypothetical protein
LFCGLGDSVGSTLRGAGAFGILQTDESAAKPPFSGIDIGDFFHDWRGVKGLFYTDYIW